MNEHSIVPNAHYTHIIFDNHRMGHGLFAVWHDNTLAHGKIIISREKRRRRRKLLPSREFHLRLFCINFIRHSFCIVSVSRCVRDHLGHRRQHHQMLYVYDTRQKKTKTSKREKKEKEFNYPKRNLLFSPRVANVTESWTKSKMNEPEILYKIKWVLCAVADLWKVSTKTRKINANKKQEKICELKWEKFEKNEIPQRTEGERERQAKKKEPENINLIFHHISTWNV